MLLHSGHITACYCRHDSNFLLIHRRLGLESDHLKTVRIIRCEQRICTRLRRFPLLDGSGAGYLGIGILIYS